MKASNVLLRDLKTTTDCLEAIESIRMDHRNVIGGLKAFNSGYQTYLTQAAEKKIEAIDRKFDKLADQAVIAEYGKLED